jgi:hypothetical protein
MDAPLEVDTQLPPYGDNGPHLWLACALTRDG